ncbi:MAG: hypothetical protein R6X34_24680 [Chloroflexota bacterium]
MKNWYFAAFVFFSFLFLGTAVFLLFIFGDTVNNVFPTDTPPEMAVETIDLTAAAAFITAVAALLGAVLTFMLAWRQEQHRQKIDQAFLEREKVELEKEKLALERLRLEMEQERENLKKKGTAPSGE